MPRLPFRSPLLIKEIGYSGGGGDGLMWTDDLGTSGFFFHSSIQASMSEDGFNFSGGGDDGLSCGTDGLSCSGNDLGTSGFFYSFNCYDYC